MSCVPEGKAGTVKVAILDDWFDTLRSLPCFEKMAGHAVTVFTDHVQDTDVLAERLSGFGALVLIRQRTKIRTALLERLPSLRLISQHGVYPQPVAGTRCCLFLWIRLLRPVPSRGDCASATNT
jgi:hypothetical protein